MRLLLPLAAIMICQSAFAESGSYAEEFRAARAIERSDPQGYLDGMLRSFQQAKEARNLEYVSVAGINACGKIYSQGKTVEAAKLAREVIAAMTPLEDFYPESTTIRRAQLFNYLGRGLQAEGKTGAALQTNRAAAETLRGKNVPVDGNGPPITLADLDGLSPELLAGGFRIIEREAELLSIAGRCIEARKLLDDAAAYLGADWSVRLRGVARFYAFKIVASRAELSDFLGYQQEAIQAGQALAAAVEGRGDLKQSHLTLRINLLRNLSQWTGPSQEIIDEARLIATEMNQQGIDNNVNRLLAKMEFDFREAREPLETLRESAEKRRGLGDAYEAFYADRDSLALRIRLGDANLDGELQALLKTLRSHGDKRAEPTLFRIYGDYLLGRNRPAEAIRMYADCLRMTRGFGWFLHEPKILGALIDARLAGDDPAGARATLAELEKWLADHPDEPVSRRAGAMGIRGEALARLGDEAAAREAFRLARGIGRDLPAYMQRDFTVEKEELAIKEMKDKSAAPAAIADVPALRVQPLEVVGIAIPSEAARTRFVVANPTARSIRGHFVLTGPGAGKHDGAVAFTVGQPVATLREPRTLAGGCESQLEVSLASGAGADAAKVEVAWDNEGQPAGPAATWDVSWTPSASRSVVLDASHLEANPFRSIPLFHELAVPVEETVGIAFRLRSPVPLRFEYLDARSHELVAIDANGNGDFNDSGDFHIRGSDGVTAAIFPTAGTKSVTAEVRIFSPDGNPLLVTGGTLVLEAEVYRNGRWTKEAEDILR